MTDLLAQTTVCKIISSWKGLLYPPIHKSTATKDQYTITSNYVRHVLLHKTLKFLNSSPHWHRIKETICKQYTALILTIELGKHNLP